MNEFLQRELFTIGSFRFDLGNLVGALLILLAAKLLYVLLQRTALKRYYRRKGVDEGRQFAVSQLIKYVIYTVAFLVAIQATGMKITVLYAAGAALLVGIGIGLQQTFNDFMSGLILLIEGSIKKGDWLQIDDMDGRVIRIGLRTSLIQTRRRIAVIVPNSKITVENVINLSHSNEFIRYQINVGVAYGSDTGLVRETLLAAASAHHKIMREPPPFVRFRDFGDSALLFELHFWCDDFQTVVDIMSELRFDIDRRFREGGITIPFPQRDLHIKSGLHVGV